MGMAQDQKIEPKPQEKSTWSMRKLFPFVAVSNAITKQFKSSFDILLAFCLIVISIVEITGRHVHWLFYCIVIILILVAFIEHPEKEDSTKPN